MKKYFLLVVVYSSILLINVGCTPAEAEIDVSINLPVSESDTEISPEIRPAQSDGLESLKRRVEKFDAQGEYEYSYGLIKDYLKKNYSYSSMQYAVTHLEKHLKQLATDNTFSDKSEFIEPEGYKPPLVAAAAATATTVAGAAATTTMAVITVEAPRFLKKQKEAKEKAESYDFALANMAKVKSNLTQYEILKRSLKFYLKVITEKYLQAHESEESQIRKLLNTCNDLKKQTAENRCAFLSFTVLSPYLAETSRKLFLATLGIDDKEKVKEAVVFLAHHCHSGWLYAVHESVREQYWNIIKAIKNALGQAEWDEMKAKTTLLDSWDESKKRGAQAWWAE